MVGIAKAEMTSATPSTIKSSSKLNPALAATPSREPPDIPRRWRLFGRSEAWWQPRTLQMALLSGIELSSFSVS
jgi:hypothetical protein